MARFLGLCLFFWYGIVYAQPESQNCRFPSAVCQARQFWLLQGNNLCLDGATCSATISYNGTNIVLGAALAPTTISATGSITAGTSSANQIAIAGSAATNSVTITGSGSDTNIGIQPVVKGSGNFNLPTNGWFSLDGTNSGTPTWGLRYNSASSRIEFATGFSGAHFYLQNANPSAILNGNIRLGNDQNNYWTLSGASGAPTIVVGGGGAGGILRASQANSGTNVAWILDNNVSLTGSTKLLSVQNNTVEKASIDNAGNTTVNNLTINGTCSGCGGAATSLTATGGNSAVVTGNQADGATAVGVVLDNNVTLANSSAKTLSIRNNTVEKASVNLNGKGTFSGGLVSGGDVTTSQVSGALCSNSTGASCNGMVDDGTNLYVRTVGASGYHIKHSDQTTVFDSYINASFGIRLDGSATGTFITASYRGTTSNPGAVGGSTCVDTSITVTGAAVNSECVVSTPAGGPGATIAAGCYVSAANTVQLHLCNTAVTSQTPTAGTYSVRTFNP